MNQYIFDSHLAKITMPGARELVNWENHDIDSPENNVLKETATEEFKSIRKIRKIA